jgi:hypothetical protein
MMTDQISLGGWTLTQHSETEEVGMEFQSLEVGDLILEQSLPSKSSVQNLSPANKDKD